jgi:hypothetical protein
LFKNSKYLTKKYAYSTITIMRVSSHSDSIKSFKEWLTMASEAELRKEIAELEARTHMPFANEWKDTDVEALYYVIDELEARRSKRKKAK